MGFGGEREVGGSRMEEARSDVTVDWAAWKSLLLRLREETLWFGVEFSSV